MKNFINMKLHLLLNILFWGTVIVLFLSNPKLTSDYAYVGLKIWFDHMIISLFPFMVIVSLLRLSGLYRYLMQPFTKILYPIFRLPIEAIFVIVFGFLSGFPLGAKLTCCLYEDGKITKDMADYLLAFVNNIGPAYYSGFVLTSILPCSGLNALVASFFLMYGIPLCYGVFLRYTIYLRRLTLTEKQTESRSFISITECLPDAIYGSCEQMTILGGYMILCNALRAVLQILLKSQPLLLLLGHCVLEISGGLKALQINCGQSLLYPVYIHTLLAFGGICCYLQTSSLLIKQGLSTQKYMLHKLILCSITFVSSYVYYQLLR